MWSCAQKMWQKDNLSWRMSSLWVGECLHAFFRINVCPKMCNAQNEEILPMASNWLDFSVLCKVKPLMCFVIFISTFHTKAFRVSNTIAVRSGYQYFIRKSKRCKNCECCPGSPYCSQITNTNIMIWGAQKLNHQHLFVAINANIFLYIMSIFGGSKVF